MVTSRQLRDYRKVLNERATHSEQRLIAHLRRNGLRLRQQAIIPPFIVDILIPRKMLVVEVDGSVHSSKKARAYDDSRTAYLNSLGFTVIRVKNEDVESQTVITKIRDHPNVLGRKSRQCTKLINSLIAKRQRP